MNQGNEVMDCSTRQKSPMLLRWLALVAFALTTAAPLLAQQAAGPRLDFGDLAEGLGRVLAPPSTAGEPIPAPPPDHFIPVRRGVDPEAIQVENDEGMVRLLVRDAPLRQVLALLAESQKMNLVFASISDATVTVSLDRVPLSTALDAILSTCGHTWCRQGNIIHVTQIAEGLSIGPMAQGRCMEVFELDYTAAADIDLAVKGLLSPVGKSWVTESSSTDNRRTREVIAVEDLPEYMNRIAAYITQTDVPPRQVMVEVQILEIDLDDDLKCGVNFEEIARIGGTSIRFETTGFADPDSPQAFFIDINGGDLSSLVDLLQSTTDAKTLASPKLLAVNGQKSRIQIGEKLPYRLTTTTQTSTQESVQFLDVGVVLEFTPWITRDGRVLMRIAPKVSQGAVNANTGLPEEATTEVETDAFLADGQGIVIGGLIKESDDIRQSKVPLLGDIPVAGVLFQHRRDTRRRSEIIVALMPHLLPYQPCVQEQTDLEVQRARDPLLYGPLCRYPRPTNRDYPTWEATTAAEYGSISDTTAGRKRATKRPGPVQTRMASADCLPAPILRRQRSN